MTTDLCLVPCCGRPRHADFVICVHCAWLLEKALGDVPALSDDLDLTLSRQTASGARNGSRSSNKPLPFDTNASEVGWLLRNTLVGWVRDLCEAHTEPGPPDTCGDMARWLLARLWRLQAHPAANEVVSEVLAAVGEARRAIDRPAERVYAGACQVPHEGVACDQPLYARLGRTVITCPKCGTGHDLQDRRERMAAELDGMLMTVREIAVVAAWLGAFTDTGRTQARLDNWASRGTIVAHGVNLKGRETYAFGDTYARMLAAWAKVAG